MSDKISVKEMIVGVIVLAVIGGAMWYTLGLFQAESGKKVIDISQAGDAAASHVETHVKLMSIDPIKGDASARFEFEPSENLLGEDGSLKQDLKLYVNSANGKQEIDFPKGKLMNPVEAVFNMHDGQATEYPYDKYIADIDIYITKAPKKDDAKKAEVVPAKPAEGEEGTQAPANPSEAEDDDMALSVDFSGSIPGYNIGAAKAKYSEIDFVGIETQIERSGTVRFVSTFVAIVTWLLTIGVLFMVISLLFRGRKIEVSMFSFMGAMLFGFYAIRNSQPNVPPIGVFSDFLSYIWCEIIIGACLIVGVLAWVLRPSK